MLLETQCCVACGDIWSENKLLGKQKYQAEVILETCEVFNIGDVLYITDFFLCFADRASQHNLSN